MIFFYSSLQKKSLFRRKLGRKISHTLPDTNFAGAAVAIATTTGSSATCTTTTYSSAICVNGRGLFKFCIHKDMSRKTLS